MRNSLSNSLLLMILVVILSGCRKDPPITPPNNGIDSTFVDSGCVDYPLPPEIGFQFKKMGDQYLSPCFNPNNAQEFVFLKESESSPLKKLYRYNMESKTEVLLYDEPVISSPKWGKSGWIVFTSLNRKIWKIREDGTGLMQLTFGAKDVTPNFTYDGSLICYNRGITYSNAELEANPELYNENKMIFIDLDGNVVDSVLALNVIPDNHYQTWLKGVYLPTKIYFEAGTSSNYGIYCLDQGTGDIHSILTWDASKTSKEVLSNLDYSSGAIYFTKVRNTLSKVNILSGAETLIKDACDTRHYNIVSISPEGNKLLIEKMVSTVLNNEDIQIQHEIWITDLDGSNEQKILG